MSNNNNNNNIENIVTFLLNQEQINIGKEIIIPFSSILFEDDFIENFVKKWYESLESKYKQYLVTCTHIGTKHLEVYDLSTYYQFFINKQYLNRIYNKSINNDTIRSSLLKNKWIEKYKQLNEILLTTISNFYPDITQIIIEYANSHYWDNIYQWQCNKNLNNDPCTVFEFLKKHTLTYVYYLITEELDENQLSIICIQSSV